MKDLSLAVRYATAAYMEAKETGNIENIQNDITVIKSIIALDKDFDILLKSVVISNVDKIAVINSISSKYNLCRSMQGLLVVLIRNERIYLVEQVIEMIIAKVHEENHEVVVDLISAGTLSSEELSGISTKIQSMIGQKIILNHTIEPSLLCGIKVVVGNSMYDMSAKGRLNALKSHLMQ